MKQFSCGSVVPGCMATFRARDEAGIFAQVAAHAKAEHGMAEVRPAVVEAVRERIVPVAR